MEEQPRDLLAIIYAITCQETGKKYVGQTMTHKKTRKRWYKYGISQRMAEHIGASRRNRTTPLAKAIREFDAAVFEIEELERCEVAESDKREAYYINKLESLCPNGYNVQKSSRCNGGTIFVKDKILAAELRGIKQNGTLSKVRLLLTVTGEKERTRVMFGSSPETYKQSIEAAKQFCKELGVVPVEHNSLRAKNVLWWPYKEKIDQFDNSVVSRIRIVPFSSTQVSIGVKTTEMKSWKEEVSMVFGSKKIAREDSLKIALSVAEELSSRHKVEYTVK